MQQSQVKSVTPNGSRKRKPVPIRWLDADVQRAYRELDQGNVVEFVNIHRRVGLTPPRNIVSDWAREALWRGDLDCALVALQLIGASADRDDLLACARAAADHGDSDVARRAAAMGRSKR